MAATVTLGISTASTTNATSYASGSFTPAVGDVLLVFAAVSGNTSGSPTVTDSLTQSTYTQIGSGVLKNSSADMIYAFISNGFCTNTTSRTVTIASLPATPSGATVVVFRIAGLSKAGLAAVRQSGSQANQALSTTPAPTFTGAALTTNPVLGVMANETNPPANTIPASFTLGANSGYATPTEGTQSVFINSGFTSSTVTWGSTVPTAFGDIVVELDATSLLVGDEHYVEPRTLKHTPAEPDITVWQ